MNLIVAVNENWGIGYEGELLERIPEDQKYFREMTTGNVVITGRKTLYTFPGKKPLKDRINIIITSDKEFRCEDAVVVHSIEELLNKINVDKYEDVFVIGGESIYNQLLPYCKYAYITKIHKDHRADKFMPNLDELENWIIIEKSDIKNYNGIEFQFITYENLKTKNY